MMENNLEKNIDESQGKEPSIKTSNKWKFVSQSQFNDLRTQVTGMETKMEKLLALLQASIAPASKKRKGTSELEVPENQFLANFKNYAGNEIYNTAKWL